MPSVTYLRNNSAVVGFSRSFVIALGFLLLASAILKSKAGPFQATALIAGHDTQWLFAIELGIEVIFGTWLISGLWHAWARRASLLLFTVFLVVALGEWVHGYKSCGCFGKVGTPPWISAVIDGLSLIGLFISKRAKRLSTSKAGIYAATLASAIAVALCGASIRQWPTLTNDPNAMASSETIIIDPAQWVGHPLAILEYIEPVPDFGHGRWILVIYDRDCGVCKDAIPQLKELAKTQPLRFMFADISAKNGATSLVESDPRWTIGRLSDNKRWFATTPTIIVMNNGKVTKSFEGRSDVRNMFLEND